MRLYPHDPVEAARCRGVLRMRETGQLLGNLIPKALGARSPHTRTERTETRVYPGSWLLTAIL